MEGERGEGAGKEGEKGCLALPLTSLPQRGLPPTGRMRCLRHKDLGRGPGRGAIGSSNQAPGGGPDAFKHHPRRKECDLEAVIFINPTHQYSSTAEV